ncbi:MAG: Smr/MutS family protein [Candidatus Neomarinimicrobiota bacterium]
MKDCEFCGNPISTTIPKCPYCGAKQEKAKTKAKKLVTCNIEKGKPLAYEALEKLEKEIRKNSSLGVKALKIIHGYGSSGPGGVIREKVIKRLRAKKQSGHIKHFYNCDFPSKNIDDLQEAYNLCPDIKEALEKDRKNKGVSYIIL